MRAWGRVILLTALLAGVQGALTGAAEGTFLGRPLAEALEILQARGLRLIYSSAIVGPGLVVGIEPRSTDPRRVLDEILAPAGLEARPGPGGSLLIVAGPGESLPERLPGRVEQVVVTPDEPSPAPLGPSGARVMDSEEMALVPNAGGDISRIVHQLPGVASADNSAGFHARGGQPRDVSMVLDGLELYEPFHLPEFHGPFSLVDGTYVDRMEYLGGSFTAEYGDRHGGFVNLSTAPPGGPGQTRAEFGSLNSRLSWSTATPDSSLLVSGRAWYPESLTTTLEIGEDGLDPKFGDAYVKFTYHAIPGTILSAHALVSYDRVRFSEPVAGESANVDNRSGHFWVRAVRSWSGSVTTDTILSAGRLDLSREGVSDADSGPISVDDNRSVDFFGIDHDTTWKLSGRQVLTGGLQMRPIRGTYEYRTLGSGQDVSLEPKPNGTNFGFYLAHRAALSTKVSTELGVRWDGQTFTGDQQISPRLNVLWRPTSRFEALLGVGRFAQSQRINELNIEDGETGFHPAELADQVTLTLQHSFDAGIRVRLDGYYRTVSAVQPRYENLFNPIELFPETEADRVLVAPNAARLRGAELLVQGGGGSRPIHWSASYTWSSAEDVLWDGIVPRSWDQRHAARFLIGYRPGALWSVALGGTAHTGWPTTPVTASSTTLPDGTVEITPVTGQRNSERLPGYLRFDLHASRAWRLSSATVALNLDILNITDRENACCVDEFRFRPRPDGSVEVHRLLDDWPGLTPTFSVTLQF
ncbi:MAG: TonB-dependent receptor plug domain-containing protein [Candidatus Polarisedimenticolia bacterium]